MALADARATIDLNFKSGLGGARHIETVELWIQYCSECGECEHRKIGGDSKPADVLTKPMFRGILMRHVGRLGCHLVQSVVTQDGGGHVAQHRSRVTLHRIFFAAILHLRRPSSDRIIHHGFIAFGVQGRSTRPRLHQLMCVCVCVYRCEGVCVCTLAWDGSGVQWASAEAEAEEDKYFFAIESAVQSPQCASKA